jgi:hypothetical protein
MALTPEMKLFLRRCVSAAKAAGLRAKGSGSFWLIVGQRLSVLDLHPFFERSNDEGVLEQVVQGARQLEEQVKSRRNVSYFETYLYALDACSERQGTLGDEWVMHPPDPDYGYQATPKNAITFGVMGCDGVHYVVLTIGGAVTDESPVVQVCPMDFSDLYQVLAESFLHFLATNCAVSLNQMELVFAKERAGEQVLIAFLKENFDLSLFWNDNRPRNLDHLLEFIEKKP